MRNGLSFAPVMAASSHSLCLRSSGLPIEKLGKSLSNSNAPSCIKLKRSPPRDRVAAVDTSIEAASVHALRKAGQMDEASSRRAG